MTHLLSGALLSLLFIFNVHADIYSASNALSRGDCATAVAEFTKLSEKGDANAQVNLGYMYYVGEGLPQDSINKRFIGTARPLSREIRMPNTILQSPTPLAKVLNKI